MDGHLTWAESGRFSVEFATYLHSTPSCTRRWIVGAIAVRRFSPVPCATMRQNDTSGSIVRDASSADVEAIVDFNARMAQETEGLVLDPSVLSAGVRAALADP